MSLTERRSPVDLEVRDGVAWITLDDPDNGNSFSAESVAALAQAVNGARAAEVGVVVLSARGPVFSVGGDLEAFERHRTPVPTSTISPKPSTASSAS